MDAACLALLRTGAATLGVPLPAPAEHQLGRYLELLLFWNRRINLTAVRTPLGIVERHFVDSLAVVPHVLSVRALADAGSGAGFPGAVVAIARPDMEVTAIEPSQKRAAFLKTLRRELPLPNLVVLAESVEQVPSTPSFTAFDAAVSRATWELPEWLAIGRRLVKEGGLVIGMEGARRVDLPAVCQRFAYVVWGVPKAIIVCPA